MLSFLYSPTLPSIHDYWKNHSLDLDRLLLAISLIFNMLSRLVITFLPRSKGLLISWLQSPSAVILEPKKIKSSTVSTVSPFICHEMKGLDAMILFSECWALSQLFQLYHNCVILSAFFDIAFLWDWNENWPLPVPWSLLSFPNLLVYWVHHCHCIIF